MGDSPIPLGVGVWSGGIPLVYQHCKLVCGTPCGLGIWGWGVGVPLLVYECCKLVFGTPCGFGVGVGAGSPFISV